MFPCSLSSSATCKARKFLFPFKSVSEKFYLWDGAFLQQPRFTDLSSKASAAEDHALAAPKRREGGSRTRRAEVRRSRITFRSSQRLLARLLLKQYAQPHGFPRSPGSA